MTNSPEQPLLFPVLGRAASILAREELPADALEAHRKLSKTAVPEVVRATLALRELRSKAAAKFRNPGFALLLPKGLEQATDGRVATWRAAEIARFAPGFVVWDCTTGLGADAIALAERGMRVLASDRDPLLAAIAGHNLSGPAANACVADATRPPLQRDTPHLLLFDPDRRADLAPQGRGRPGGGRRRLDPRDFAPPIETWPALLATATGASVKLPPALDPTELESTGPLAGFLAATPHRWTWTEAGGALRELTLWTGRLAPQDAPERAAVRLFGPGFPAPGEAPPSAQLHAGGAAPPALPLPDPEAITLIAEIRPSARRAGLAPYACAETLASLAPIDSGEAYFATVEPAAHARPTAFVDLFRVLGSAPLDKKRVRKLCAAHGVGPLTIKKRGLTESSATLERRLAAQQGQPGLAIACPTRAGRRLFLVERL